MRDMLRRRLQEGESVASQWSNDTLNFYLNRGLQWIHRQIIKINPEAIIYTATADTTAAVTDYPKPVNMQREVFVYTKASSAAAYKQIERIPYYAIVEDQAHRTGYALKGRFFVLKPSPTTSVSGGLKIEYIPTLSMSTDSEVPDLVEDIHEGIVFRAEMIALGDCALEAPIAERELKILSDEIPLYYKKSEFPDYYEQDITKWSTGD
jgi:hypothetical protein